MSSALTATGKEQALVDFYRQLKRDGLTVSELARRARVGRAHLARLLSARSTGRQSGRFTWKHVLPLLSPEALCALKQCSAWNNFAERELGHLERTKAWMKARDEGISIP